MVAEPKELASDAPWGSLSDQEQDTVELKAHGWRTKEIAAHQGIHRATVYRRLEKADAQAYLNHLRTERSSETKAKMAEATNSSIHTVLRAAEGGDAKVALAWLALAPKYGKGHLNTV